MEATAAFRSAMVSRLPKFGGRPSNGTTSALPNSSTQQASPQEEKTSHLNGVIRAPSFSFKWKKDEGATSSSPRTDGASEEKPKTEIAVPAKEVKKVSPGTPKLRRSGSLMVAVSSPKIIPKTAKTNSKSDSKTSQSHPNGGSLVGPCRSAPTEFLPVKPKPHSSSPRSSSQDSLSQSSDSLKNLTVDNMVRSNSFTHFKQIPSPSNQPMTRSFSFNRAVELAKPLANTQLKPPRTSLLKPPQLSNGRVGLGMAGLNGNLTGSGSLSTSLGALHYSKPLPNVSSLPTLPTPSAPNTPKSLKKPLLPNCVLNKSKNNNVPSVGSKLVRSPAVRQQPLLPGRAKEKPQLLAPERKSRVALTSDTKPMEMSDIHSDSEGNSQDKKDLCQLNQCGKYPEISEDMSVSSASSLDRGDTSEDFLDDFDSPGDVLSDVDAAENTENTASAQSRLQRLLDDTADWLQTDAAEETVISPMDVSCGSLVLSHESSHVPAASSTELSPSNSSGGTYMWDEEGLEPIEGSASHPEDSYEDTDLNSIDILNNLEPFGAAELEEDDLMLDVDLPVDSQHEMSHVEQSERGRPGPRRRHHRWSASDHFHNNSSRLHGFPHYDGFKAPRFSSRPFYPNGKQPDQIQALDDLTLEHMTQDCSDLKTHLLRLQKLLQLEDENSPAHAAEVEAEDKSRELQLQELMKEVQGLREELRNRDRTIAQLTLQCQQLKQQPQQMPAQGQQVKCQCHHQRGSHSLRTSDQQMEKHKHQQQHCDKTTQTHYRPPANTGVLPTPMLSPWQAQQQARPSMQQRRHTSNTTAFQPQLQRAAVSGKSSKSSLHRGPQ